MSCPSSEYGTHRCVRCDSEVEDADALRAENERLRAYVAKLESEPSPAEALAEVERLRAERDEAYDREAAAFDALADEQIRAGKAGAEVERLRGLIAEAEWSVTHSYTGSPSCPWCNYPARRHHSRCPAFSARGEVRR